MISYNFAGFPFGNACNTYESVPTDYVGSFNLVTGDGQSGATVTIDAESTAYSYCLQDMIRFRDPSAFPAIPQFQREDSQWMTPDQESATRLLGWTSVVVCVIYEYTGDMYYSTKTDQSVIMLCSSCLRLCHLSRDYGLIRGVI